MERSAVSFNPGSDYLYAIVHGLPRGWRPPAEGIGGAPVRTVPVRDVVVVASHLATPVSRTPLNQAVHADVVEVAARAQSVLPFAFGTVLPQALEPWVCARLPLVRASLRRLRGAVEMQVRLVSLDACPRDLEALARRLVDAAGVPTWAYREAPRLAAASVTFLVRRRAVSEFLERIAPVASRAAGVAVVPSGPLPPYSFTPSLETAASPVLAAS